MGRDATIEVCGQTLILCADRAVFWCEKRTLLVADLHWLREEVAQAAGYAWPQESLTKDLARLGGLIEKYEVERVLVLGDLIHHVSALKNSGESFAKIQNFRDTHPCEFLLIRGNHDRGIQTLLPSSWNISVLQSELEETPFYFIHEARDSELSENAGYFISGHVHPMIKLAIGREGLRLPCFALTRHQLLIPAFSSLAGGANIEMRHYHSVYAITPDRVIAVKN